MEQACLDCHGPHDPQAKLDLTQLNFDLADRTTREHWIRIHDRVRSGEMPPAEADPLFKPQRAKFVASLAKSIENADLTEVRRHGRAPMRRLNRDEFQQNLRDILALPGLDIRDFLPEDRESEHFNKTSSALDLTRVQLSAYLDAATVALVTAVASGVQPPTAAKQRFVGRQLFSVTATFGNQQAMFFAKDSKAIDKETLKKNPHDPTIELALFRSAHWPYYGYPQNFVARKTGDYRVRFSARAVLQTPGFKLKPAQFATPMTFRARKPSGADVSGDVRATGGLIDIAPKRGEYETTIFLLAGETFEYSLLGLPVPLARNVNGGPPTYRYPPFPENGQPGVAFQWLEIDGPLSPANWPPESHRVLFDNLQIHRAPVEDEFPIRVNSAEPKKDAHRLLRRFVNRAARQPVPEHALQRFNILIERHLDDGAPFAEAMILGYRAFLCSGHSLYLQEPLAVDDHFAIAARLSHLLGDTLPDSQLQNRAKRQQLRDADVLRVETDRLIQQQSFLRFVDHFCDYWLSLRHLQRDEPDHRLYPEYRFDNYLTESMGRETRATFAAMIRENLPATVLVDAKFAFVNDRLAKHYGLPSVEGSRIRKVALPENSPYGGLLTQAAILKVTANGVATSPVTRGAWIMDRLLGQPPPAPPESVPAVEPDIRGAKTVRELLDQHASSKVCADCHARFDPIGAALESFDIMGRWRTNYRALGEKPTVRGIDRAGHDFAFTVSAKVEHGGALMDGRKFGGIRELKTLLSNDPRPLARNLLRQFTIYATGSPVRFSDRREVERILDTCADDGYRVADLLHGLVQSKIFLGPAGCQPSKKASP